MRMEVYRGPEKDGSVKKRWKCLQKDGRVFRRRIEGYLGGEWKCVEERNKVC